MPSDSVTGALGGQTYTFGYTYNVDGRRYGVVPGGRRDESETLHYDYDNLGSAYSLWSGGRITCSGRSTPRPACRPRSTWARARRRSGRGCSICTIRRRRAEQEPGPAGDGSANWNLISDTSYPTTRR